MEDHPGTSRYSYLSILQTVGQSKKVGTDGNLVAERPETVNSPKTAESEYQPGVQQHHVMLLVLNY